MLAGFIGKKQVIFSNVQLKPPLPAKMPLCSITLSYSDRILSLLKLTPPEPVIAPNVKLPPPLTPVCLLS